MFGVVGYVDSNYARYLEDKESIIRYYFLFEGAITI